MKMLHKVILCFHCVTKCPFNMSPYIKTQDCTLEAGQNDWLLLHVTRDGLFLIGPCQGLCAQVKSAFKFGCPGPNLVLRKAFTSGNYT